MFSLQREGIAILARDDGTGLIVCTDQIPGGSVLRVYRREGQPGRPHAHDPALASITTASDTTDGIDGTIASLGDRFPSGLLVMMNSAGRNYQLYDLRNLLQVGDTAMTRGARHPWHEIGRLRSHARTTELLGVDQETAPASVVSTWLEKLQVDLNTESATGLDTNHTTDDRDLVA